MSFLINRTNEWATGPTLSEIYTFLGRSHNRRSSCLFRGSRRLLQVADPSAGPAPPLLSTSTALPVVCLLLTQTPSTISAVHSRAGVIALYQAAVVRMWDSILL